MKANIETIQTVHLQLTVEEARLLMGLLQNPLTENEDPLIADLRKAVFTALQNAINLR